MVPHRDTGICSALSRWVGNSRPIGSGLLFGALWVCLVVYSAVARADVGALPWQVGVSRVDITPEFPIRLAGFAFRRAESEGVRQHLFAKALAMSHGDDPPVVIVTVDCMAISDDLVLRVAKKVESACGVPVERFALTATHSHTAPALTGVCPTLFTVPIPPEHQTHIDQYTDQLVDRAAQAAIDAIKDRQPARMDWGIGRVGFAKNRRTAGGPVDHDLPFLLVRGENDAVRAVYVSYACHCVTLSDNRVSGDWAGFAQEHLERLFPGAVGLVSVGCGADSNPSSGVTGDKADVASTQGLEVAQESLRLSKADLRPVNGPLSVMYQRIELPFDTLPTRAQWEERAKRTDAIGYHAKVQIAKLDRGEKLPTQLSYPIQTFAFADSLAMVFLPGEVVVDYSLRLKRELDGARLWTNGYSNSVPCYIPSERVWKEGGYEGGDAMVYFDRPARFASGLEQPIVEVVLSQLTGRFSPQVDASRTRGSRPLSPERSLAALRPRAGTAVDLVVAEPLVTSPVAIDFGPDGKLWVAEMYDYPQGIDGNYQPGGRVRLVESSHADGKFDKSTVFLDGIPFPTGLTVWRNGVLVCAAPDILYAEDTDGDGRADVVKKLFSGYGTHNYQARVNSLEYGLDGWVYGSCGLFGGRITNFRGESFDLGDQDFRIQPDTGAIEAAVGRTQQGRPRDDAGNWFGCDNSNLCRHYPLAAQYVRRNPHVAPPPAASFAGEGADPFRLYPAREVQLFKLSGPSGRATAACGLGIYRDDLLGSDYRGNAFICEPVNLVVHRMPLVARGSSFAGTRATGEEQSEFLSSDDNWFRPVQARTGPDGALWIVDMYRYIIEHPRWIPPEEVSKLDVRAGHDRGRIYRVRPADQSPRPWTRLDRLDGAGLVAALDTPNGWQRDMASQLLVWRKATGARDSS
ncbi:MAG: neutral/alkaline non-lysosomal ceramidase N-terminal domain-containing protein [Planctomycetota bacterium]|nr:neutral/alkaline non-lysosomal ceramidase N-terminal domain-containing protein [Planctomycetota bacterium]